MLRKGFLQTHSSWVEFVARVLDQIAIFVAGWLAIYLSVGRAALDGSYSLALVTGLLLSAIVLQLFRLYDTWRGQPFVQEVRTLVGAWACVFLLLSVLAVVTKTSTTFSRLWFGYWFVMGGSALIIMRFALRYALRTLRARGRNTRSVVIVGAGGLGQAVANRLLSAPWAGLRFVGYFDDRPDLLRRADSRPVLGAIADLAAYVEREHIDQVWIALPWKCEDEVKHTLEALQFSTADVRMVPDIFSYNLFNHSVTDVAGLPVINLSASPMEGINRIVKGLEDRLIALVILLLISPVMLAITIGIKLTSPGPVFFKQLRHGWGGGVVKVYKFRSMVVHQEESGQVTQASRKDPRITRFGAFLRRTSLDELPQFINVLRGEMSIVGPRPHAVYHTELYKGQVRNYMLRHKVKPGITGWAQVNGYRGETDTLDKMQKRVEYDLYYIQNWSLWFDLKIILLTIFTGFRHRNAY